MNMQGKITVDFHEGGFKLAHTRQPDDTAIFSLVCRIDRIDELPALLEQMKLSIQGYLDSEAIPKEKLQ